MNLVRRAIRFCGNTIMSPEFAIAAIAVVLFLSYHLVEVLYNNGKLVGLE